MSQLYKHKQVEAKWQKRWDEEKTYLADVAASNPFYNLWMFPYPSAEGVHVGTIFSSTGSDIYGRYLRMNSFNVFQPMGYDSFGIHSENFALKTGKPPQRIVPQTIKNYERQFKAIGHGYDWTRTVTTSEIDYYRWTQWLFVEMFKAGLAYKKTAFVNWCPGCKTVLADEQITTPAQAGKVPPGYERIEDVPEGIRVCERCGNIPKRRELSQWFFRITDYADRLLGGLQKIDWTEKVKIAQREWIGKKDGINITYPVLDTQLTITCFTTRPDTNFGATFIVVSPEFAKSQLLQVLPEEYKDKVSNYIETSLGKTEQQRKQEGRKKTGEFTGLYAVNQLNNYPMPIWVSDFVLAGFGTGAVVGVPGHDKRDFEFAREFGLSIKRVVVGKDGDTSEVENISQVQENQGTMVNSEFLDGLDIHAATKKIMDFLEKKGWGTKATAYHLRDWLVSRQRYWGPPIPMIWCKDCAKKGKSFFSAHKPSVRNDQTDWDPSGWYPEENLPIQLPDIEDYKPKGEGKGPLASHPEFYEVKCPVCGSDAERETDVSDTFVDSSWYFLRYPSVGLESDTSLPFDTQATKHWLPVDLYFGGAEHSVLHLMYARFVTMMLHDLKLIDFDEPFPRFYAHGLMIKDGAKMSKSKGNVVNPDEYIEKFGADTLRLYLVFMGPMDGYPDFRDTGIEGMHRFLQRVWAVFTSKPKQHGTPEVDIKMHQTIKKVTNDIENFRFNTATSAIMEYVNVLKDGHQKSHLIVLAQLLAPFAPHMMEEVWNTLLKQPFSIHKSLWPKFDEKYLQQENVTIIVQVNGRLRGQVVVGKDQSGQKEYVISQAKDLENVAKWIEGKQVKEEIFVPGKILNFVI